jgi:peptidylprolyl isomerase
MHLMKQFSLIVLVGFSATAALAQTHAKPAVASKPAAASSANSGVKLPAGVPPVHGVVKTAFSLRYEDIKIGTGAPAEPNKVYKVNYTGWLTANGQKFDSSYDHRTPVLDKDGMPVMGTNGLPKTTDPEPISFPQGYGRVVPGFDQGFHGMRVGGKRRLFIPWQLAYGERGRPGIPPRSDLIFDVELVDVLDLQMPSNHPAITPGKSPLHPGMTLPSGHIPVTPQQK